MMLLRIMHVMVEGRWGEIRRFNKDIAETAGHKCAEENKGTEQLGRAFIMLRQISNTDLRHYYFKGTTFN